MALPIGQATKAVLGSLTKIWRDIAMNGHMLELHFNQPAKVHTRYLYAEARNFFIPLSGTHANIAAYLQVSRINRGLVSSI